MQSLFPTAPTELGYDDLAELYAYPAERRWLRANFVSSLDGAAQGSDHRSGSLSSRADRRIVGLLRSLCDVIVVGANTARTEGYLPVTSNETRSALRSRLGLAPLPAIAVVSRSLRLDLTLLKGGEAPTVVLTTRSAPPERVAEVRALAPVIVAGDRSVDLDEAFDSLVARGFQRMLCEGGPTLMRTLVAAGLADEICLDDTSRAGRRPPPDDVEAVIDPPASFALRHVLEDESQLFCRYTRN